LGAVSFLNARPLVCGLDADRDVQLLFDVPALLPGLLSRGEVDAALIPIVDLMRGPGDYRVLSDACIGCDGETMTVRVFSQTPPDRIHKLWVDTDSHTSIALAAVVWRELYGRPITLQPFDPRKQSADELESVLLIGDKVVDAGRGGFGYEIDLGGAWRAHTGLPFVFAVWACRADTDEQVCAELAGRLSRARDAGVARAVEIARRDGPTLGWPVELAIRYLTRRLTFTLDARHIEGANRFAALCAAGDIVPGTGEIPWPPDLTSPKVEVGP
jgi:chorismate dehydratase